MPIAALLTTAALSLSPRGLADVLQPEESQEMHTMISQVVAAHYGKHYDPKLTEASCESVASSLRAGQAPLPRALRGVFWQEDVPGALLSFGVREPLDAAQPALVLEMASDRAMAWSTPDEARQAQQYEPELRFHFDSATEPRSAFVAATAKRHSGKRTAQYAEVLGFTNVTMKLREDGGDGPASVVWGLMTPEGGDAGGSLVQIVDEHGETLAPAFDRFVSLCSASEQAGVTYLATPPESDEVAAATVEAQGVLSTISSVFGQIGGGMSAFLGKVMKNAPVAALFVFDKRFSLYSKIFCLVLNKQASEWVRPTVQDVAVSPTAMLQIPKSKEAHVALKIAGGQVPDVTDAQKDVEEGIKVSDILSGVKNTVVQGVLDNSWFPETADECGKWEKDETPEETLRTFTVAYPDDRMLVNWNQKRDRYGDEALSDLVFFGHGQHRLELLTAQNRPSYRGIPRTAKYAVLLNWAAGAETRPGFAKLGADAFFDAASMPVGIYRAGKMFTPTGEQGREAYCKSSYFFWKKCYKATVGWKHAKMAFRSTLSAVITLADHLYMLHFLFGNAIITNNVELLPPVSPLRKLLTPSGFRTEAINLLAAKALEPDRQLVHRATGLTKRGMETVYDVARKASPFKVYEALLSTDDFSLDVGSITPSGELPIVEDGREYSKIVHSFVNDYLQLFYSFDNPSACLTDEIKAWWQAVDDIAFPARDMPPLNCTTLTGMIAKSMILVSAAHRHVGNVAAEVVDPCFAPWGFREGELCGTPSTTGTTAVIMLGTAKNQPRIMEDYSPIMPTAKAKALWRKMGRELGALGKKVERRNKQRRWPSATFATEMIETAISI